MKAAATQPLPSPIASKFQANKQSSSDRIRPLKAPKMPSTEVAKAEAVSLVRVAAACLCALPVCFCFRSGICNVVEGWVADFLKSAATTVRLDTGKGDYLMEVKGSYSFMVGQVKDCGGVPAAHFAPIIMAVLMTAAVTAVAFVCAAVAVRMPLLVASVSETLIVVAEDTCTKTTNAIHSI